MSSPRKNMQTAAVPYGWEEGQLYIGLVTAYRSHNWTLPKISRSQEANAAETASNEAVRQGGYLGLADPKPLLTEVTAKGVETTYYAVEIHGVLDTWDAQRTQSRKLVPFNKLEKFLHERPSLRAVHALTRLRLDAKLLETPEASPKTEDESVGG